MNSHLADADQIRRRIYAAQKGVEFTEFVGNWWIQQDVQRTAAPLVEWPRELNN